MEILFTFNHNAGTTNEAYLINGKTLSSVIKEVAEERTNEIAKVVSDYMNDHVKINDKDLCEFVATKFKDDVNELAVASMLAGREIFKGSEPVRMGTMMNLLGANENTTSEIVEKLVNSTREKALKLEDVKISNEFVFSAGMIIVGVYHQAMHDLEGDGHGPSKENCEKCTSKSCPIRVADHVDPSSN